MNVPEYYRLIVMKEEWIQGRGYQEVVVGNHVYMLEGDVDFEYLDDILWHLMLDHEYAVKLKKIDKPARHEEVNAFTVRGKTYSFGYVPEETRESEFCYVKENEE